jgi:acetyl esterase
MQMTSPRPDTLDPQSRALLREYDAMKLKWADRVVAGGMAASRAFADAVFDRFRGRERDVAPDATIDLMVPGGAGERPARLYRPAGDTPPPVALYLHGGGWSLGGIEAYDGLVGSLSALSGVAILSLDYRLAPEHPFPAALADAAAALAWLAGESGQFGLDPSRIALIGDSAGGNLAAVLARDAADSGMLAIARQLLLYPMTDVASPHECFASRRDYGGGDYFLMNAGIEFARDAYLGTNRDAAASARVSPLLGPVPAALAPAFILTAGHDPLRDEAHDYHRKLRRAGIDSDYRCIDDTIHAFLSFGVLDCAQAARRQVADALRSGLMP